MPSSPCRSSTIACSYFLLLLLPLFFFFFFFSSCSALRAPRVLVLVPSPQTILTYHNGPLLTSPNPINLYFIWYGSFSPAQKSILSDFASSFSDPSPSSSSSANGSAPSVASWWSMASAYTDGSNASVSSRVLLAPQSATVQSAQTARAAQAAPAAQTESVLKKADIEAVVLERLKKGELPLDKSGLYLVLTSEEVKVEEFCMSSCGFHDSAVAVTAQGGEPERVAYGWVGNSAKQCPGYCAWPFAKAEYGPRGQEPLEPPNGDVGVEGMVINMATVLGGAATNPFLNGGYYQGDSRAPLEAVSACAGIFGEGAYPGDPGSLLFKDGSGGAAYNVDGSNGRRFLLPAMWSPVSKRCTPVQLPSRR